MLKNNLERKVQYLKKEIKYYTRVYPNSDKIKVLKCMYRHYKKRLKSNFSFY